MCGTKKLRFIKEQNASGLLSSLRIKILLNQIPLFSKTLFLMQFNSYYNNLIKMN